MWEFWYIREASTAVLVANMPMCWPLLRRIFNLKAFSGKESGSGVHFSTGARSRSLPIATTYSNRKLHPMGARGTSNDEYNPEVTLNTDGRGSRGKGDVSWWERNDSGISKTESEEYIIGNGKRDVPLEIWESRRVDVESGSIDTRESGGKRDLRKDQVRIYDGIGVRGMGEFESTVKIEAGRKASMSSLGRG